MIVFVDMLIFLVIYEVSMSHMARPSAALKPTRMVRWMRTDLRVKTGTLCLSSTEPIWPSLLSSSPWAIYC